MGEDGNKEGGRGGKRREGKGMVNSRKRERTRGDDLELAEGSDAQHGLDGVDVPQGGGEELHGEGTLLLSIEELLRRTSS